MTSEFIKLPELPKDYFFEIDFDVNGDLEVTVRREVTHFKSKKVAWDYASHDRVLIVAGQLAKKINDGLPYVGEYKE